MKSTVQNLPTEIWLSILRHVPPHDLFHSLRLVNHNSLSCTNDVFRNELLPTLQISIHVSLASEYPLRPGGHAQVLFRFQQIEPGVAETAQFSLQSVEPSTRRERALVKLQQSVHADALTDWQVFEMCLPPGESVSLHGRVWHDFLIEGMEAGVEMHDASGEVLRLDWRKVVAAYLARSSDVYVEGI